MKVVMEANAGCEKKWVGKVVKCLCLLLVFLVHLSCAGRSTVGIATFGGGGCNSSIRELEVHKQLKKLNRPPVKTIKSPDGDIIDCVHIYNQPAFDHPALKNHKIQMRPSFHPKGKTFEDSKVSSNSNKPLTQLWHKNGRCPKGTIPIRRTKKDDILRASSIQNFGKKKQGSIHQPKSEKPQLDLDNKSGHEYAIAYINGDKYYGSKATISVWSPKIENPNEFSISQMWVLAGTFGQDLNSIEAGWQVGPQLYGDNHTRLFIYWTGDAYKSTGCYNLNCPGFIQVNNNIALGTTIYPISKYGSTQYEITILIWKDQKTGNWWMVYGKNNVMGYWPAHLFSHLSDSASLIEWGGEVVNSEFNRQHTTTQMGSGHFAYEGFRKASFFRNIQFVDGANKLTVVKDFSTYIDQEKCYNVKIVSPGILGNRFYYGGPGRNPGCS